MPIRDLLKKKDKVENHDAPAPAPEFEPPPKFTFMRSDTNTQELIRPPTFSSQDSSSPPSFVDGHVESKTSRLFKGRSRSTSVNSQASASSSKSKNANPKRLSQRLHLRRSEPTSESVPADLPEIHVPDEDEDNGGEARESQWEKRATMLARKNEERSRPTTPLGGSNTDLGSFQDLNIGGGSREKAVVSTKQADDNIQEAIRLHEAGELETSTRMFGRLADPNGENNALSQVLYGLALRYVQLVLLHAMAITPMAFKLNQSMGRSLRRF